MSRFVILLTLVFLLPACTTTGTTFSARQPDGSPPEGLILQYAITSLDSGQQRRGALQVVGIREDTVSLRQMVGPQVSERLDFYRGLVPIGVSSAQSDLPPSLESELANDQHFALAVAPERLADLWPLAEGKSIRVSDVPSALPVSLSAQEADSIATRAATLDIRVSGTATVSLEDVPREVLVIDIDRTPADGETARLKVWYSEDLGLALQTALATVRNGEEQVQQVLTVQRLILPVAAE